MNFRHVLGVLLMAIIGCGAAPEPVTVPGPESDSLLAAAKGFIIMQPPGGGIVAVELPTLRKITVLAESDVNAADQPDIHMLSGPDSQGRIAYIEDHFFVADKTARRHLLKTVRLDGTGDTALFTRSGDAMWADTAVGHGEIGRTIALAPTGGWVAFVSGLRDVQMPSALLSQGSIEIWNIDKKTGEKTDVQAEDDGLSWFPDGRHLAYVKLIDRKADSEWIDPADPIANRFIEYKWTRIPAVFIRDEQNQTERFFHTGWRPIVSPDGSKVLIRGFGGNFYCAEHATGKISPLTGTGMDDVIGMLDEKTVLVTDYPTAGSEVKFTGAWPVNGPAEMLAVKLARTDSPAFETVIPYVTPMAKISFGVGKAAGSQATRTAR